MLVNAQFISRMRAVVNVAFSFPVNSIEEMATTITAAVGLNASEKKTVMTNLKRLYKTVNVL
jgi:hypothetical protein